MMKNKALSLISIVLFCVGLTHAMEKETEDNKQIVSTTTTQSVTVPTNLSFKQRLWFYRYSSPEILIGLISEKGFNHNDPTHITFYNQTVKELIEQKDVVNLIELFTLLRNKPYRKKIHLELDEKTKKEGTILLAHHHKAYHQQRAQELDEKRKLYCQMVTASLQQTIDQLQNLYITWTNQINIDRSKIKGDVQNQRIKTHRAFLVINSLEKMWLCTEKKCLFHASINLPAEIKSLPGVKKEIINFQEESKKTIAALKKTVSDFQSLMFIQNYLK